MHNNGMHMTIWNSALCPGTTGGLKVPSRPPAAGKNDHWSSHVVPPHNIHTACDLQTADSGETILKTCSCVHRVVVLL